MMGVVLSSKAIFSAWSKFKNCKRGVTAIIFAIVLIPISLIIGGAIDYAQINGVKAELQERLDSSVLAGSIVKVESPALRPKNAQEHFEATTPDRLKRNIVSLEFEMLDNDRVLKGTLHTSIETSILGLLGYGSLPFKVESQATTNAAGRHLDMVFCIDVTGSMGGTITWVKQEAIDLENNINRELEARNLGAFEGMRARVIFFRDVSYDKGSVDQYGTPSMKPGLHPGINRSNGKAFWNLPSASANVSNFIGGEIATGGGDAPESGFVCLNEALHSDWAKTGDPIPGLPGRNITQVIPMVVIWTDADARPLSDQVPGSVLQPPSSHDGLRAVWDDRSVIDQDGKMIVHFGHTALSVDGSGQVPTAPEAEGRKDSEGSAPSVVASRPEDPPCIIMPDGECEPGTGGVPTSTSAPEWEATIGTWGIGEDVFMYKLQPGSTNLAKKLVDAIETKSNAPRLTR